MTIYYSVHARSHNELAEIDTFRIVHVCIANQSRSPMGERLTQHELGIHVNEYLNVWEVESAGTQATEGHPMHRYAEGTLASWGVNVNGFRSRQLTAMIASSADLVLAATVAERDHVISLVPTALPRIFTLREFARLVAAVSSHSKTAEGSIAAYARMVVADARNMRGRLPYVEASADDIVDPPRNPAAFAQCGVDIHAAVKTIVAALIPPGVSTRSSWKAVSTVS